MALHHEHHAVNFGQAFLTGIILNLVFVVTEFWFGVQSGSLALMADAGHNLSDVAGLIIAWVAYAALRLKPNDRHSYGWRKGSILAGFLNGGLLLFAMGALAWEALDRFSAPSEVEGGTVIIVALIGLIINSVTALLFFRGSKQDLNIKGAFLHMAADALVSAGVVVAGIMYLWTGLSWIDPVVSLAICMVVIGATWSLFRRSLHLLFDGVPDGIDLKVCETGLRVIEGVRSVHDLHIWAMSTRETALTVHLVVSDAVNSEHILSQATEYLHGMKIEHITIQVESEYFAVRCDSGVCGA